MRAERSLYKGLQDIKTAILQWNQLETRDTKEGLELLELVKLQAAELEFGADLDWSEQAIETTITHLRALLVEYENELIPCGLHVIGEAPSLSERADLLHAHQQCSDGPSPSKQDVMELLASAERRVGDDHDAGAHSGLTAPSPNDNPDGTSAEDAWKASLLAMNTHLTADAELTGLVHALDAGYIPAAPGGDVLHNADSLPAGRNIHGFDPFRLPTAFARQSGTRQAELLLERHRAESGTWPRSVAFVLWGSDNLKNEGVPIAQVMALMGARPRFDAYGKLCGSELISLEELGRPRIDVLTTLSGVFRDLLPLQTRMLAEAALIASQADEPVEMNFVRKHSLDYQARHQCDLETAALRVFSNADGAYGANVNLLIDSGAWESEDELADTYANRKCYAFGANGEASRQPQRLETALADVDLAYQNLESVELGVTQLDYYFDTLGGINSMVKKARGEAVPTYIGDQTRGTDAVRTLQEQVNLETRTRMLNPKWYEGQLKHGYEGVRNIETSITNTMGWSATTGQISPWVYNQMASTFILDDAMRERLAELNPAASSRMASRLIEASERNYWSPSEDVLQALHDASDELEDRLEGVITTTPAAPKDKVPMADAAA